VLPDLIHLNKQTGVLYGTPREVGKFPFTLRLTDSAEMFVEKNFILEVKEGKIEIITGSLPPRQKGRNTPSPSVPGAAWYPTGGRWSPATLRRVCGSIRNGG